MFQQILDRVNASGVSNIYLYLIVRSLKPDKKANSRVTEKYDFDLRQIDIDDEIRGYLQALTVDSLQKIIKKQPDLHEYSPITDSTQQAFTYSMENNAISFSSVINTHASGTIDKVHDFRQIVQNETLWAYCVGFYDPAKDEWAYTFRKVRPGQAVADENNPDQKKGIIQRLQTRFNSTNDKLEILKGETFILEKGIDCYYFENKFFVVSKSAFEEILDLKVEQEKEARDCVEEIKSLGVLKEIDMLAGMLDGNTALHKKLVKLKSLGHYKSLDLNKVKKVIDELSLQVKIDGKQLSIDDPKEMNTVVRLLGEYYKQGLVSGDTYGTFAGVKIPK